MSKKEPIKHKDLFPVDLKTLLKGNIYRNVNICSRRAEQIEEARLLQMKEKRNEWINYNQQFMGFNIESSTLERISKYFEKMEKATNIAVEEFLAGDLSVDNVNTEGEEK